MADRFRERTEDFAQALARLKEVLAQAENEFIRDAAIQRFEFTYELGWKAMKHALSLRDIDVRNAKDTLKEALAQGLIADAEAWGRLHRMRNLTSHSYDAALAEEVYAYVKTDGVTLFDAALASLAAWK